MGSGASKRGGQQGGHSPNSRRKKKADDAAQADFYAHRFDRQSKGQEQAEDESLAGRRDKVVSERVPDGFATYVAHDLKEGLATLDLLERRAIAAIAEESADHQLDQLASGLAIIRRVLLDVRAKDVSFRVDNDALDDETSRWLAEKTGVSGRSGRRWFRLDNACGCALTVMYPPTYSSLLMTGPARAPSIALGGHRDLDQRSLSPPWCTALPLSQRATCCSHLVTRRALLPVCRLAQGRREQEEEEEEEEQVEEGG